jgi:hypothetical protein
MMQDAQRKLNPGISWQNQLSIRRFFFQQIGLKFKAETSKVLRLEYGAETGAVWDVDRK